MSHSGLVQVGACPRLAQALGMCHVCLALAGPAWPHGLAWPDLALVRPDLDWPNWSLLPQAYSGHSLIQVGLTK